MTKTIAGTVPADRPVLLDDLMAATGLTRRQVTADVRAGLLPGRMRGRRYVCPPGEYARWLAGEWVARPQPQPVTMLHKRSA
jgi:hypothetical protein